MYHHLQLVKINNENQKVLKCFFIAKTEKLLFVDRSNKMVNSKGQITKYSVVQLLFLE